jgi:peptidoglycan/LPS O-acetylase OafA/YrhL
VTSSTSFQNTLVESASLVADRTRPPLTIADVHSRPRYRADIDGLRGVAVAAVLAYHAFPQSLPGGFVGVDVFFVISGYLITGLIITGVAGGQFSLRDFYARRAKRIFPALVLTLSASYLFGWFFLHADEFKSLGKHIAGGAGFVANLVLQQESGYFDKAAEFKPLLHLWSLGIEEQFYLFWPPLACAALTRRWNLVRLVTLGALLSCAVTFLPVTSSTPADLFYLSPARFWQLLIGAALACRESSPTSANRSRVPRASPAWENLKTFLGILLIGYSSYTLTTATAFPHYQAFVPTIGAALVVSSKPDCLMARSLLSARPLVILGLISYPLYLWHWPLLSFARILLGFSPSLGLRWSILLTSTVLAWLTYRFVERPVRFGSPSFPADSGGTVFVLIAALGAIGLAGLMTYAGDGFPRRTANKATLFKPYDISVPYRGGRCFLDGVDTGQSYAPECDPPALTEAAKPRVILWGDSHAAALYPGLKSFRDQYRFSLGQYTAGGCAPILGFASENRPACPALSAAVLTKLTSFKPELLIIGAYWALYDGNGGWGKVNAAQLQETVGYALANGAKRVVIFGALPPFDDDHPKISASLFRPFLKNRTYQNFHPAAAAHNQLLATLALPRGAAFVSPTDILCNQDGCLLSTSEKEFDPINADSGHLTESGSRMLIRMAIERGLLDLPRL